MKGRASGPSRTRSTALVVVVVVGLVLVAVLVVWALPILLTRRPEVHGAERHAAMGEVRNSLLTALGALGAVVGLAYTARSYRLSQVGHLTGRFQDAAKLMADPDHMAKLGGIEAMAQLADEWPDERQRCIDMLCAHVRHAVAPDGGRPEPVDHEADTRRRVIELVRDSVVDGSAKSWQGHHFDLRGAVLGGFDLTGLSISSVSFDFSGARFVPGADEVPIDLTGSILRDVVLRFDDAEFSPSSGVDLSRTRLVGSTVRFDGAYVNRATLTFAGAVVDADASISFDRVKADDGTFTFDEAHVHGALSFTGARLGQDLGTGSVSFDGAEIATTVSFDGAEIDRLVTFRGTDLRRGGLSVVTSPPPTPPLLLAGAACEGTVIVCSDPSRPIEVAIDDAEGRPELRAPDLDGAEPLGGR